MITKRIVTLLSALVLLGAPSMAQDPAERLAPLIHEDAWIVAVARIDVAAVSRDAVEEDILAIFRDAAAASASPQLADEAMAELRPQLQTARQMAQAFLDAGGRELYVVAEFSEHGTLDRDQPLPVRWFFLVPMENPREAAAMRRLFGVAEQDQGSPLVAFVVPGALVLGEPRYLQVAAVERPIDAARLRPALASFARLPLQGAVVLLSDDTRRVLADMLPPTPPEAGSVELGPLARQFRWTAAGAQVAPQWTVTAVAQLDSPEAAEAMRATLEASRRAGIEQLRQHAGASLVPALELAQVLERLAPRTQGNQVALALPHPQLREAMGAVLLPAFVAAREEAKANISAANLQHIGNALHLYATDRDGQWAPSLQALRDADHVPDRTLRNPLRPGLEIGYEYVPPAEPINRLQTPAQVMIAWERFDAWPAQGVAALFADAHVERIRDEQQFRQLRPQR